ncbi:hypothetical protein [Streptomyces sp. JJ66]|uniref:hypothetical protein n=1 Tax=Streptomyces sp. JJ66 TaxID=2803843 RepID=UPI00214C883F|nr:hypothetical protein [Streptomyces sp. JJ66]
MPNRPPYDTTYGFDHATRTVRVHHHDLARLLLMFRSLMRETQKPDSWEHMHDYDLSFERLADAADAAAEIVCGEKWQGPDLRMRCTTTEPVYDWPEGGPYDGEATFTWKVPGYGSHASDDDQVQHHSNTGRAGWRGCLSARSAGVRCSSVPTARAAPGDNCRAATRCRRVATSGYGGGYDAQRPGPGSCNAGAGPLPGAATRARRCSGRSGCSGAG